MDIEYLLESYQPALEWNLTKIETELNKGASYPILGSLAGFTKSFLGIMQLITSLAVAIFVLCAVRCNQMAVRCIKVTFKHLCHALANIITGVFLSVPFFGMIINCCVGSHMYKYCKK